MAAGFGRGCKEGLDALPYRPEEFALAVGLEGFLAFPAAVRGENVAEPEVLPDLQMEAAGEGANARSGFGVDLHEGVHGIRVERHADGAEQHAVWGV